MTHPLSAALVPLEMTPSTGRRPSSAPQTLRSKVVSSSWTSTFLQTTRSSLPNLHSRRVSTTPTSTVTGPSASTFSGPSGRLLSQCPRCCCRYVHYCVIQTPTTRWCPRSRGSTRPTWPSTTSAPGSGLGSTPCERGGAKHFYITQQKHSDGLKYNFLLIQNSEVLVIAHNDADGHMIIVNLGRECFCQYPCWRPWTELSGYWQKENIFLCWR